MELRLPDNEKSAGWKVAFLQYFVVATFLVLLVGYWRLQIGRHNYFLEQAERNRIRNLPVIAPRGRILDREGRVLVDNFPAFSVLLIRENPAALSPARIQGIARGLGLGPVDIERLIERTARLPRFQPVVLKQSATLDDIAFVESHRIEYPELALIQVHQRLYPKHTVAAAVLGYVGEVSEEAIAKAGSPYRPGDVIGKFGIEGEYNSVLSGRDGMRRVIVNSRGQEVGSMTTINALPGNDIRLTLDLNLQMVAEAALGERSGAVVALDPRTGEVLALVSHPSFDPNDFARRIDRDTWRQLMSDPEKPLMNKAIQAQLAPGSVFKIITGIAALETRTIKPDFTISCPGSVTIYGHIYHDWRKGHGTVNFHRAIVVSCDVYFYTLGELLGIDKIAYYAKVLGLGAPTGIDLPNEDKGLVPSREWAKKTLKRNWRPGETIPVAVGQGALTVTPLQLDYVIAGIVSGGVFRRPHLAFRDQLLALGVDPPEVIERHFRLSETALEAVTRGMWGVVNEGGTGAGAQCPGIEIAGKTGTAQVVSAQLKQSARDPEFKNNGWFVGYSPSANPEIVVAVLVLEGEHSSVATPVAREVIKAYFEKQRSRKLKPDLEQREVRLMSQAEGFLSPKMKSSAEVQ